MNSFFLLLAFASQVWTAELKHGRYIGWISLDSKQERLAVVADFFIESPEDYTQFPKLNAVFKISLGGYNTHEYISESFHDLKYDFDHGALTFSEDGNNLLMTTQVTSKGGRAKISGNVYFRSSAARGKLELLEESDEPGDDLVAQLIDNVPFVPLLEGQYEGLCNGKQAVLQIQTIRGLLNEENGSKGLEQNYGIAGRLAFKEDPLCGTLENSFWCSKRHYHSGSYDFTTGKLQFESRQGSESCEVKGNEIRCRWTTLREPMDCGFQKPSATSSARFFPRAFFLETTKEQREPLPDPQPPRNQDLHEALEGSFFGYLHNETNNSYLPLKLDVTPFSSTENPHNPNQLSIAATASIFLNQDFSGNSITQNYSPRSFYVRPGFQLSSPDSDFQLSIQTWRKGFVTGTWMSKSFGKVGTFQLVKGKPSSPPDDIKFAYSFAGEFLGRLRKSEQKIQFSFPNLSKNLQENTIPFMGSFQTLVGNSPIRAIEAGAFDLFTGRLGWAIKHDDIIGFGSGFVSGPNEIQLYWPPLPLLGTAVPSLEFRTFLRR